MKKKISLILAGVLLAGNISAYAATPGDIADHWCGNIIEKWLEAEKVSGYPDGTFKPDNFITRAEFAKILSSILPDMPYPDEIEYEDVNEGDWFYESVRKLATLSVIAKDTHFNPAREITRQEAITMAGRAFYYSSENADALSFTDSDKIADYAKEFVAGLFEAGMISGYEDNTIRPENSITRAESIKILDGFGLVYEADSLEGIMDKIYMGAYKEEKPSVAYTRIDSESVNYFLGLDSMDGILEALGAEPMMSSSAHSVCLVRAAEGADIERLKADIKENVDPRKWICVGVEREDIIVNNIENLIILIMDSANPKAIEESFLSLENELLPKISADENGIILHNGYYMDSLGALDEGSAVKFAQNIENLAAALPESASTYFAAVPGKQYYINDRLENPFNYEKMNSILTENIKSAEIINLYNALTLEDYCKSDIHWKQEKLSGVLNALGEKIGFSSDLSLYKQNEIADFKGYFAQKVEGVEGESIAYLTSDVTDGASVDHFTVKDFGGIYNEAMLSGKDPYTFFLSGAAPLITITNNTAEAEKELVIFGDSYTLSIAPLMLEHYKSITIVDLRLMSAKLLDEYVDFENKDVLMLYSDAVINESLMLKF